MTGAEVLSADLMTRWELVDHLPGPDSANLPVREFLLVLTFGFNHRGLARDLGIGSQKPEVGLPLEQLFSNSRPCLDDASF